MATVFRKRLASQVVPILKPFLEGVEKVVMYDSIPACIKLRPYENGSPQFELSWNDVTRLKPDLKSRLHPNTVLSYLKNQTFPTAEGITDVWLEITKHEHFVFSVEQELFTSSILLDLCNRIDVLPNESCFFRNVPLETVIVEYSSPNIAKPFHYGHFRSTILGNFLANLFKYVGHEVKTINYVGDWGLQYGILATGFNQFGSEEKLNLNPLAHLFEVYKEANEINTNNAKFNEDSKKYFKSMEDGDVIALSQWKKLRDISLHEMNKTYKRLNISFDEIHGESMHADKTKPILNMLMEKKLATCNSDGSVQIKLAGGKGKEETVILRKNDGTTLYLSRDVAAAVHRKNNFHFDSMYYVVDSTQSKHFNHLKSILKLMGHEWSSDMHHVQYGRVLNFSTRKGTAVFLDDILNEAQERTLENMEKSPTTKVFDKMEEVADILGIASLIINDFCTRRKKECHFSWENVLSMNSDSGVTLQYCHARLKSIKDNCGVGLLLNSDLSTLTEKEAISLIHHLARFDETIYNTYKELEPCILVHYLFTLRQEIGRAIKVLNVKGANPYAARARLVLFHTAHLVLKKSLQILGITPLDKM